MTPRLDAIPPEEATAQSATNVALIALCSAAGLLILWPTDLLVVGHHGDILAAFGRFRLVAAGCCVCLAWLVHRVPVIRRHPAVALVVGCLITSGVSLHALEPYDTLDQRWMDLRYLLPLATCAVLVPLRHRIALTLALTLGWLALYFLVAPQELKRDLLWVHLLVHGLAMGVSIYVGHVITQLLARSYATVHALERSKDRLTERVAGRQAVLRERYAQIVGTREEERTRLGRELHDATGQLLTGLRLSLGSFRKNVEGDDARRMGRIDASLDELFSAFQRVQHDLHPRVLDDLGLPAALTWLADLTHERRDVSVSVWIGSLRWVVGEVPPGPSEPWTTLSPFVRLGLYRVAQLGLGLLASQDGTHAITLALRIEGDELVLRLEGDQALPSAPGREPELDTVLLEITERARMLDAQLAVSHSRPATVELRWPWSPS